MIAGILIGGALFARALAGHGVERRTAFRIVLFSIFGGLAGARLFHIVDYLDFFTGAPFHIIYLWEGATRSGAAYWPGSPRGLWQAGRQGLARASTADAATFPGALGLAIGRLGGIIGGDPAAAESSLAVGLHLRPPGLGRVRRRLSRPPRRALRDTLGRRHRTVRHPVGQAGAGGSRHTACTRCMGVRRFAIAFARGRPCYVRPPAGPVGGSSSSPPLPCGRGALDCGTPSERETRTGRRCVVLERHAQALLALPVVHVQRVHEVHLLHAALPLLVERDCLPYRAA